MFYNFSFLQSLQWILFSCGVTIEPCLKFYTVPSQSQFMTLRSDWVDAHENLSLCWAHKSVCWFCQAVAGQGHFNEFLVRLLAVSHSLGDISSR